MAITEERLREILKVPPDKPFNYVSWLVQTPEGTAALRQAGVTTAYGWLTVTKVDGPAVGIEIEGKSTPLD